ncbi:hypothetical protein N8Z40_05795, partial [Pseudomonadales bacterium]|nr:hypothetical protein [Pseudomonadales bacterium]
MSVLIEQIEHQGHTLKVKVEILLQASCLDTAQDLVAVELVTGQCFNDANIDQFVNIFSWQPGGLTKFR